MIIPQNYQEWHNCITLNCGIPLDKAFIEKRINALEDNNDEYTKSFIEVYGQAHLRRVLKWFNQANTMFTIREI